MTRYLHWCSNTGEIVEKANYSESGSRYVATIRRHTLSSGVAICAFDASLSKSAFDLFAVGTPGHRLIVFRWRDAEYTFATQTVAKKTFALIVSEGENSGVMLSYDNGFPSRTCSIGTTAGIHPDDFISVTADDFAHGVSKTYRIGTDGTIANGDSLFCGFGCGTNPVHWDTDGDGLSDGWEKANGLNPLNAADASQDMDRDGLSNLQECLSGTDIRVADTDGDGKIDTEDARTLLRAAVGLISPGDLRFTTRVNQFHLTLGPLRSYHDGGFLWNQRSKHDAADCND